MSIESSKLHHKSTPSVLRDRLLLSALKLRLASSASVGTTLRLPTPRCSACVLGRCCNDSCSHYSVGLRQSPGAGVRLQRNTTAAFHSTMVNQTMEALQFNSKTKTLSLVTETIPSVKENEVLVKVAYAGVCGTDLHIVEGSFPCTDRPVILGHEFSGTVTAVGSKVTSVKVGDKVAVDPNSGCNTCGPCSGGQYHYCSTGGINSTIGIYCNGGWAQYCTAPDTQVYKLPDNIALEQGALTEPISCLSHGWDKVQPIPVGSSILITGAGIIGNLWACLLHVQGHRKVTISEPLEERRKITEKLGTGFKVVSPAELKKYKEKDPEFGFDVVIECSGNGKAMEDALWMLNCGGKFCVFGVASPDTRVSVSPYHLYKQEISIIAVNINPFSFPKALGFIDSMGTRYLDYEKLGIKTFSLKQYKEALEELKKGSIAKAIFKVEQ